jgi:hypothetical protein
MPVLAAYQVGETIDDHALHFLDDGVSGSVDGGHISLYKLERLER